MVVWEFQEEIQCVVANSEEYSFTQEYQVTNSYVKRNIVLLLLTSDPDK